jgi:hypothetical protein
MQGRTNGKLPIIPSGTASLAAASGKPNSEGGGGPQRRVFVAGVEGGVEGGSFNPRMKSTD